MAQANLFGIGVSGLKASQLALATAGHNVSNANTEGYTRQRVEVSARIATFNGGGLQGAGVQVDDVKRVADRYLTGQIRLDTSSAQSAKSYLDNAGAIDNLLADEQTGLAPGLQSFFSAMQEASSDPTSVPARRLVLSEAGSLSARLHTLYDRLSEQNGAVTGELDASARQISTYAQGIAAMNEAIQRSGGGDGNAPNDLLDQRDELLRKLAEEVDVNVVQQGDGQTNVFIGSGQVLVVGAEARTLSTDPASGALRLSGVGGAQDISELLTGGRTGGLLRFRREVLAPTLNGIGRTAQALAQEFNAQHAQGVDLNGDFGGLLFKDINAIDAAADRVVRVKGSENADVRLFVDDATQIEAGDYAVSFSGPGDDAFEVRRARDGAVVGRGTIDGELPVSVSFDSLRLEIHGGDFHAGDQFTLQPTRFGARDIGVALTDPSALALASPLRVSADVGNTGTAGIDGARVVDVNSAAFAVPGELAPPLMVRFTSETSYDVLDGSDPTNPRPLDPPLHNLPFVPGVSNALLPGQDGESIAYSDGARAGRLPAAATLLRSDQANTGALGNGYVAERLSFTQTTAQGPQTANIDLAAGQSARTVAAALNGVRGVVARADTQVTLSGLVASSASPALQVTINGRDFAGDAVHSLATLADAINADGALKAAGVSARSDGSTLVLRSSVGDDLRVALRGDAGDGLTLQDARGGTLALHGAGEGTPATLTGTVNRAAGFDFRVGGPYSFALAVDGGAAHEITLDNDYNDGIELARGLQSEIDAAVGAGRVTVDIGSNGALRLRSTRSDAGAQLAISGAPTGSAFQRAFGLGDGTARGYDALQGAAIGGEVQLIVDDGVQFDVTPTRPGGSLFADAPALVAPFLGYQVNLSGRPQAGDTFSVGFNGGGSSDNRNGLALAALQNAAIVGGGRSGKGTSTLADSYGEVVQIVGARTSAARVDSGAADGLLQQSTALRESYSGVNLDEEAADLLRYQQAYTASARVISTARDLFDSLLTIFR